MYMCSLNSYSLLCLVNTGGGGDREASPRPLDPLQVIDKFDIIFRHVLMLVTEILCQDQNFWNNPPICTMYDQLTSQLN